MQERVTITGYQDNGLSLSLVLAASSKRGERQLKVRIARYFGPLGMSPRYQDMREVELDRLAAGRGVVEQAEGVSDGNAHQLAWWAAGMAGQGKNPVGMWAVWNLQKPGK